MLKRSLDETEQGILRERSRRVDFEANNARIYTEEVAKLAVRTGGIGIDDEGGNRGPYAVER
jgi:hypothetical protein